MTTKTLASLLSSLEHHRDSFPVVREFLLQKEIRTQRSWKSIGDQLNTIINEPTEWSKFAPDFIRFLQGIFLFGTKRLYVLTVTVPNPERLSASERTETLDFLESKPPEREPNVPSFFCGHWTLDNMQIFTYVTSRSATQSEKVVPSSLAAQAQAKYLSSELIARSPVPVRCYDHIVLLNGCQYLLIDAPGTVRTDQVASDLYRYEAAIRNQLSIDGKPIFADVFPIINPMYRDKKEGIVNYINFRSNDNSTTINKYQHNSVKDLRDQKFQRGGEKEGAQVNPYELGVKWLQFECKPAIFFNGEKGMACGSVGEQHSRAPLDYVHLPGHMDFSAFAHVVSRLQYHLEKVNSSSVSPVDSLPLPISSSV